MSETVPGPKPLEPVPGGQAFTDETESHIASRAAQYLALTGRVLGISGASGYRSLEARTLGVPEVNADAETPVGRLRSSRRRDEDVEAFAFESAGDQILGDPGDAGRSQRAQGLWWKVNETGDPAAILALLAVGTQSPHEVEATSAALSLEVLANGRAERSSAKRRAMLDAKSELARALAAVLEPHHGSYSRNDPWSGSGSGGVPADPASTTVHGTWSLTNHGGWHSPGSDMHHYLRREVAPTLYDQPDYFRWSGGYTDYARTHGAQLLHDWASRGFVQAHQLDSIFAHSHGGNVALGAIQNGLEVDLLVLMHTPALRRASDEWAAIRANVGGTIVLRTRMDLVVLGDSLRTRGNNFKFNPDTLPHFDVVGSWRRRDAWFNHDFYLSPDTWKRQGIPGLIQAYRRSVGF